MLAALGFGWSGSVCPSAPGGRLVVGPLVGAFVSGGGPLRLAWLAFGLQNLSAWVRLPTLGLVSAVPRRFGGGTSQSSSFSLIYIYIFIAQVITAVFCQSTIEGAARDKDQGWNWDSQGFSHACVQPSMYSASSCMLFSSAVFGLIIHVATNSNTDKQDDVFIEWRLGSA